MLQMLFDAIGRLLKPVLTKSAFLLKHPEWLGVIGSILYILVSILGVLYNYLLLSYFKIAVLDYYAVSDFLLVGLQNFSVYLFTLAFSPVTFFLICFIILLPISLIYLVFKFTVNLFRVHKIETDYVFDQIATILTVIIAICSPLSLLWAFTHDEARLIREGRGDRVIIKSDTHESIKKTGIELKGNLVLIGNAGNYAFIFNKELLFKMDVKFLGDLNKKILSADVRQEFERNGILLEKDATIAIYDTDKSNMHWLILSGSERYILQKEANDLKIYDRDKTDGHTYILPKDSIALIKIESGYGRQLSLFKAFLGIFH